MPTPANRDGFISISPFGEANCVPPQSLFPLSSKKELLLGEELLPPLDLVIMKSWNKPHFEWIKWIEKLSHKFENDWKTMGIHQLIQMSKIGQPFQPNLLYAATRL